MKSKRLDRGEVMVWKSWLPHRVTPVTGGRRHVLVVEWWNEAEQLGAELVHRMSEPPNPKEYCLQVARAAKGLYDFNACWGYNAPEQVQELVREYKLLQNREVKTEPEQSEFRARAEVGGEGGGARRPPGYFGRYLGDEL